MPRRRSTSRKGKRTKRGISARRKSFKSTVIKGNGGRASRRTTVSRGKKVRAFREWGEKQQRDGTFPIFKNWGGGAPKKIGNVSTYDFISYGKRHRREELQKAWHRNRWIGPWEEPKPGKGPKTFITPIREGIQDIASSFGKWLSGNVKGYAGGAVLQEVLGHALSYVPQNFVEPFVRVITSNPYMFAAYQAASLLGKQAIINWMMTQDADKSWLNGETKMSELEKGAALMGLGTQELANYMDIHRDELAAQWHAIVPPGDGPDPAWGMGAQPPGAVPAPMAWNGDAVVGGQPAPPVGAVDVAMERLADLFGGVRAHDRVGFADQMWDPQDWVVPNVPVAVVEGGGAPPPPLWTPRK